MSKVKRKLTTILATDCVGFSKRMDENEELTLENLKACRSIIDPQIKEFGGRIFYTAGDSVIAEFESPVECVNAAIGFQKAINDRNNTLPEGSQLDWSDDLQSGGFKVSNPNAEVTCSCGESFSA